MTRGVFVGLRMFQSSSVELATRLWALLGFVLRAVQYACSGVVQLAQDVASFERNEALSSPVSQASGEATVALAKGVLLKVCLTGRLLLVLPAVHARHQIKWQGRRLGSVMRGLPFRVGGPKKPAELVALGLCILG